jgi:hypothetical protein
MDRMKKKVLLGSVILNGLYLYIRACIRNIMGMHFPDLFLLSRRGMLKNGS